MNILNRFRIAICTIKDIDIINNLWLKKPPKGPIIPYLFYTNKKVIIYNDQVFLNASEPTFCFEAIDIWYRSLQASYLIPANPNKTVGFHKTI
jgi:hypothetical protein